MLPHRLHYGEDAQHIGAHEVVGAHDGAVNEGLGSEVYHPIYARKQGGYIPLYADVPTDEVEFWSPLHLQQVFPSATIVELIQDDYLPVGVFSGDVAGEV
ncbi:hypothetical protein ES703_95533 [subsurface metagenome]